ncbi:transcriptional regulator, LacI family [Bifidobacterium sp. DSM 109958]|uniref:Transcriptional regulator, LacI family n=2 Tax=Bifidobacterium moraviense TaxID=2675323 RepID=A0A7Y0F2V9_9BIFI|nr:transcriptional regulator, LacI family [Bifidobacterium sp. DSM 109958]
MVTMADVAREAGVSAATVSYVVSGSRQISAPTAAKVRAAIAKLGYEVNQTARNLASSRTGTIGIVVPSYKAAGFSLSLSSFLCDYATNANARGYDTLLLTDAYDEMTTLRKAVAMKKVDGVILMDAERDDPRLPVLRDAGLPAVLMGPLPDGGSASAALPSLDGVYTDFAAAADEAIACLYDHGHRDVVLVADASRLERRGVQYVTLFGTEARRAAEARGMTLHVIADGDDAGQADGADNADANSIDANATDGSADVIDRALDRWPEATAMIIHNDAATIGASQVLQRRGCAVPRDLSVMAIVPARLAESLRIPFTSIRADSRVLAKAAVDMLADRIADPGHPSAQRLVHAAMTDLGSVADRR